MLDRGPPPLSSTPSDSAPCRCSTRHASRAAPEGLEARAVEYRKSWACFCRASTVAASPEEVEVCFSSHLAPPRLHASRAASSTRPRALLALGPRELRRQ